MNRSFVAIATITMMVLSLSVTGCTSTSTNPNTDAPFTSAIQTMNPRPDYTSHYNSVKYYDVNGNTIASSFTRSTNVRGNDLYTTTLRSSAVTSTVAHELAKTKAEAQQLFNNTVEDKQQSGFATNAEQINNLKKPPRGATAYYVDVWAGKVGSQLFDITYQYEPSVNSWEVTTTNSTTV